MDTRLWSFTGRSIPARRTLRPADIHIPDIARSLALTNRWGGHTLYPFSVAHHSLLVARYLAFGQAVKKRALALQGLLHDAAEGYYGDVAGPLKQVWWMYPYRRRERRFLRTLFAMHHLCPEISPAVREADEACAHLEAECLFPVAPPWLNPDLVKKAMHRIQVTELAPVGWRDVEEMWCEQYIELTGGAHWPSGLPTSF